MYVQPEGVFRCLVDYDDNVSGSPTEAAVALGFNGPVLCHKGTFFFQKVVMCGCGDGANSSWLFFFYILHSVVQVLHGGQLTVNHLFSSLSEWEEAGEN